MQMKQRSAVSTTIVMLMPSTPTKYSMLKASIHVPCCTNWKPCALGWKRASSTTARRSGGALNAVAVQRMASCARDGKLSTTTIPRSGMKIIRVSRGSAFMSILPRRQSRCRRPRPIEEHAAQHAEEHDVEVGVDRPALHVADAPADELGDVGDPVDGAVHHVEVEPPREPRPAAHERGRAVDEAVDHVQVEPGRRAAEKERAAHEDEPVELVDPVLVQDGAVGKPAQGLAEGLGPEALAGVHLVGEADAARRHG